MATYKPIELNEADESAAQQIAATLNETEKVPIEQIRRMIAFLGVEKVNEFVKQAQAIEAEGGLYYDSEGQRKRRTIGGVFFQTARRNTFPRRLWKKKIHISFKNRQNIAQNISSQSTSTVKSVPPYEWEARIEDVKAFKSQDIGVATVEVKLIGVPAKVIDKGAVMLLVMTGKLPTAMPKGLPELPESYQPVYLAMIAKKQWKKVADKIEAGERLLLTGFPIYDEQLKRITVLVRSTQTIPSKKPKDKKTDS